MRVGRQEDGVADTTVVHEQRPCFVMLATGNVSVVVHRLFSKRRRCKCFLIAFEANRKREETSALTPSFFLRPLRRASEPTTTKLDINSTYTVVTVKRFFSIVYDTVA